MHFKHIQNENTTGGESHGEGIWHYRSRSIVGLKRLLNCSGAQIINFYPHLLQKKQFGRFLERVEQPEKDWKTSAAGIKERGLWKQCMTGYAACLAAMSTSKVLSYVVLADDKESAGLIVSRIIPDTLGDQDMTYTVLKRLAA